MYLKRLSLQLIFIGICLLALLGLQDAARTTRFVRAAQAEVDFVSADAQGVHLAWPGVRAANAALADLPTVRYQGYELPMQLITVLLDDNVQTAALDQITVVAEPWQAPLTPAAPLAPPVLDWQPTVSAALPEAVALPTAPIFVLRQGRIHGQRIAVVAISPIYNDQGQTKLAATLTGVIPSVQLMDSTAADLLHTSRAAQASDGTIPPTPESSPTINPLAPTSAIKIIVENVGVQQISGQALADAGLAIAAVDPAQLQLQHQGASVPLELAGLVHGRLAPTSQVRFYAPVVGDRWNLDEHYWLTVAPGDGGAQLRMPIRSVAAANAAARDDAIERGSGWTTCSMIRSRPAAMGIIGSTPSWISPRTRCRV